MVLVRQEAEDLLGAERLLVDPRVQLAFLEEEQLVEPHGESALRREVRLRRDVAVKLA